jgi:hypothetical protein
VERVVGRNHFLYHFIDEVFGSFGSNRERRDVRSMTTPLIDHGMLSAHRLLDMVDIGKLDSQKRSCVLHTALAIACHNCPEILRKWKLGRECSGDLSIGAFPVCSILSFCDSVQTWDREPEIDPTITRTEAYDDFFARLILSDSAYISGSEICEFSTCGRDDTSRYDISMRLRYFVEASGGVKEVCEKLGDDIQKWIDSGRLQEVCKMMGLASLLHGRVIYELPMLAGVKKVTF